MLPRYSPMKCSNNDFLEISRIFGKSTEMLFVSERLKRVSTYYACSTEEAFLYKIF